MEEKQRRKRKIKFNRRITVDLASEQLSLIDQVADHTDENRADTIREALEIGVARMQKKYGVTHG